MIENPGVLVSHPNFVWFISVGGRGERAIRENQIGPMHHILIGSGWARKMILSGHAKPRENFDVAPGPFACTNYSTNLTWLLLERKLRVVWRTNRNVEIARGHSVLDFVVKLFLARSAH